MKSQVQWPTLALEDSRILTAVQQLPTILMEIKRSAKEEAHANEVYYFICSSFKSQRRHSNRYECPFSAQILARNWPTSSELSFTPPSSAKS